MDYKTGGWCSPGRRADDSRLTCRDREHVARSDEHHLAISREAYETSQHIPLRKRETRRAVHLPFLECLVAGCLICIPNRRPSKSRIPEWASQALLISRPSLHRRLGLPAQFLLESTLVLCWSHHSHGDLILILRPSRASPLVKVLLQLQSKFIPKLVLLLQRRAPWIKTKPTYQYYYYETSTRPLGGWFQSLQLQSKFILQLTLSFQGGCSSDQD